MTFIFEDDGQNVAPTLPDVRSSLAASFQIRVIATNDPPSFHLPFAVSAASCTQSYESAYDGCQCSPFEARTSTASSCVAVADLERDVTSEQHDDTFCSGASVQIAQSFAGEEAQVVQGFGAGISSAYGYQPSSLILYKPTRTHVPEFPERPYLVQDLEPISPHDDALYAGLSMDRYGADPLGSLDSMQLAVSTAISPDRRHQYAAEPETNSISIHVFTSIGSIQFIDRLAHGENRLRFRPPYNAVAHLRSTPSSMGTNHTDCIVPNASDPDDVLLLSNVTAGPSGVRGVNGSWVNCSNDTMAENICLGACKAMGTATPDVLLRCALECAESLPTTFVCGLEVFNSTRNNDTLIAVAAGCESLSDLARGYESSPSCSPADLTPECGPACCASINHATVGLWNFTEQAILNAPRRINAFSGEHYLNCSESSCTYHRPRRFISACSERHDTW